MDMYGSNKVICLVQITAILARDRWFFVGFAMLEKKREEKFCRHTLHTILYTLIRTQLLAGGSI